MSHFEKAIFTELHCDDFLRNLETLAGWQDPQGSPKPPLSDGAFEMRVKLQKNQFTIVARYPYRFNPFAPICRGFVMAKSEGGSTVQAHFRVNRPTVGFFVLWFGTLSLMIWDFAKHQLLASHGFLAPTTEALAPFVVEILFLVPVAGLVFILAKIGFQFEHSQDAITRLLERAAHFRAESTS